MSTFADEARAESVKKPAVPCSVGALLASLPEDVSADVRAGVNDLSIQGEAVARVIERRFEVKIQGQTIQRHRNRRCQCE